MQEVGRMKTERKLIVIGLVVFLLMMSMHSMYASRTITSSSDDIFTRIVNSKGNTWAATATNLQTAIYDLNGTGGKIILPAEVSDMIPSLAPSLLITDKKSKKAYTFSYDFINKNFETGLYFRL